MSACNSGFEPAVRPLLDAGVPIIVGVNGVVGSDSTIEFASKLYDSLAVGFSLDEAVLFPRAQTRVVKSHRARVKREHTATVTRRTS